MTLLNSMLLFAADNMIERPPGAIAGPLANLLGIVFNAIFEFSALFSGSLALGIAIIIITLLMRTLILPLGIKSHKSIMKMHRVQPEMEAIKKKYDGKKDPELTRKMQVEIQQLYAKHKINPLMGCLPMLLTLPVFIGLNTIMRQMFRYVNRIGDLYSEISQLIIEAIPNPAVGFSYEFAGLRELIRPLVPSNISGFDITYVPDLNSAVARFTSEHWEAIRNLISDPYKVAELNVLLERREALETFIGLDMTSLSGIGWPGIVIPILSVITTALSSYLIQRASKSKDPAQKMQQRIMLIGMPVFIGFITVQMAVGVGIYWVTSNIYQIGQHYILTKYYANREL